jgi:acetate kinase
MKQSLILVLNCGSSSIKFAVIEPEAGNTTFYGLVQRIGTPEASIKYFHNQKHASQDLENIDYRSALQHIIKMLRDMPDIYSNITAVGHRIVHGEEMFTESVIITDEVLNAVRDCVHLAPLHNPANIMGVEEAQKAFPKLPQVAVFDTAFHQTMPQHAYIYPIPYEFYKKHRVRRYGFHGTSHRFVSAEAARILGKKLSACAFISAHLGNGCSATAILNGKSIDTTMGLTPLEGLVMGTRSGDVDPSLHSYLADHLGYDVHKVTEILNKKSGLLGISGHGSDMRSIEKKMQEGSARAQLAFEIFCYRLAKYIASLAVPLGHIDALIFTGGIGENSPLVRAKTLGWLKVFQFELSSKRNNENGKHSKGIITVDNSTIAIVVPTNEELLIARDTAFLAQKFS